MSLASNRIVAAALAGLLAGAAGPAIAQGMTVPNSRTVPPGGPATIADLEAAERGIVDLWARIPYGVRRALFVSRKAEVLGDYETRPSSVFAPGEPLLTYLEPVGYGWATLGEGRFGSGVTTDYEIVTPDGRVLGGQKSFLTANFSSRYHNRELFLSLTLTIDRIAPGDYVLAYTLHDRASERTARVEQPFTIRPGG